MTNTEAHQILDGIKNGIPTPQYKITLALLVTGDIGIPARLRGQGMDKPLPGEDEGSWPKRCQTLVGQNH